jgi:hypothetical protein
VVIETVWGKGYLLAPHMKDRLRSLADQQRPEESTASSPRPSSTSNAAEAYVEARSTVADALGDAPYGLTLWALRRATGLAPSKLEQALGGLINSGAVRRDFTRRGNEFVYGLQEQRAAS